MWPDRRKFYIDAGLQSSLFGYFGHAHTCCYTKFRTGYSVANLGSDRGHLLFGRWFTKSYGRCLGPPFPTSGFISSHEEGALSPSRNQQQRARPYVICQNVLVPVNWGFEDSVHLSEYRHPDTWLVLHTLNKTFKECWLGIVGCEVRSAILASCWASSWLLVSTKFHHHQYVSNLVFTKLFKRGASEAAEGCLASVAAKLVKTAIEISFYIHARGNKSSAANLGHFGAFSYAFKNLLWDTCAWK